MVRTYRFIEERRTYQTEYVREYFNLENKVLLELQTFPKDAGTIQINTITPDELPWDGYYYNGVPVELTITPNNGFTFSHWQSLYTILDKNSNLNISYNFEKDDQITAFFEEAPMVPSIEIFPTLVQNELNIQMSLTEISDIEIQLFDAMGRMSDFPKEKKNVGNQLIQLDVKDLPRGFYFLQIKVNEEFFTEKIMHF